MVGMAKELPVRPVRKLDMVLPTVYGNKIIIGYLIHTNWMVSARSVK